MEDKAKLIFVTDDINSAVRGSDSDGVVHNPYSITQAEQLTRGRVIGTAFTTEAIGVDEDGIAVDEPDTLNIVSTEDGGE